MPWPFWSSTKKDNDTTRAALPTYEQATQPRGSWESNINTIDWSHYTSPQTITACVITAGTTLALVRLYRTYLLRIPTVSSIEPSRLRRRSLYGYVTRVGDADNFHLFHTPGGRLAGWGWWPGRKVQDMKTTELRGKTVHVRIAGVDAPEMAHFGKSAQPFSAEAYDWLNGYVMRRFVRVKLHRKDQYERVVGTVLRRRWVGWRTDVGYEMLKRGWATIYEAKSGSEFGGKEQKYRAAERRAKERGVGMWQQPGLVGKLLGMKAKTVESPRDYKTKTAATEQETKSGTQGKK